MTTVNNESMPIQDMFKKIVLGLSALLVFQTPSKANWDYWAVDYSGDENVGNRIYTIDSSTGSTKLRTTRLFQENSWSSVSSYVDDTTGNIVFSTGSGTLETYDLEKDSWSIIGKDWKEDFQATFKKPSITGNTDGSTSVGQGDSTIIIDSNGRSLLTGGGENLIGSKEGGEIHIGVNSLITVEEDGRQKLYAKDVDGNAIPIDITEGSDLLINGTSVMGSIEENAKDIETNRKNISTNTGNIETNRKNINDLGYGVAGATALTAALSSLPIAADDAPFSCGVGTGGYSSRFAVGIGCASRLSDRLSINVGGSHVFGGSSSYGGGSLDAVAARGGFVFKLGTIHKRSNLDEEELQSLLDEVKQENDSIREENKDLIARLERLEAITLDREASVTKVSMK